jgi:hypothetical protein
MSVEQPELACWGAKASKDVLARMIEQASGNPSGNPSRNPSVRPSVHPSGNPSDDVPEPFPEGSGNPSGNPSPTPAPAPRPRTSSKTSSKTGAAPAETPADDGLFDAPSRPESEGQLVNRLTRTYTDRVKLTAFHAVAGVVKAAVRARTDGVREYSDTQITDGLRQLAEDRRTVTQNSLRIAIEGLPPPTRRVEEPRAGSSVWDRIAQPNDQGREPT